MILWMRISRHLWQAESVCVTLSLFSSPELSFWCDVSSNKVCERKYLKEQVRALTMTCPGVILAASDAGKHPKANHKLH